MKIKKKDFEAAIQQAYNEGYTKGLIFAIDHPQVANAKKALIEMGGRLLNIFAGSEEGTSQGETEE